MRGVGWGFVEIEKGVKRLGDCGNKGRSGVLEGVI